MNTEGKEATAGLVFLGNREFDVVALGNRVSATLETLGRKAKGLRIQSDESAWISAEGLRVILCTDRDRDVPMLRQPAPSFLSVQVSPDPDAETQEDVPFEAILAHVLKSLHGTLSADYIQWLDATVLLSSGDFIMATTLPDGATDARPRRVKSATTSKRRVSATRLPSIEETNEILQTRLSERQAKDDAYEIHDELREVFRQEPEDHAAAASGLVEPAEADPREPTPLLRLSAWLFSIAVSLIVLPVGVALMVINLLRGENLRLSTQAAALSGVFVALQTSGATAQALSTLQGLLG
mgnify:CR=1 FL=1